LSKSLTARWRRCVVHLDDWPYDEAVSAEPDGHANVIPSHSRDEGLAMMKRVKAIKTAAHPVEVPALRWLAAGALALALIAIPHLAHAQGVVGGMERGAAQGSYDGGRVAGPVGSAVGGAVGAGVGGAVGAVDGILGIPGPRCHGYYNRYGHWRCYRY
jgi:hypothetical protein